MATETEAWVGPEVFRPLLTPVEALRTHPDNPRRGDLETIATSLREFGQLKPVIVHDLDGQETIFAGNHTYRAARELLGWTHIAVSRPAYLSDEEADAYLLMDNRAADLATYDYGELTAILEERHEAGTLHRTGFGEDDLDELRKEAAQIAGAALDEFGEARDEAPAARREPDSEAARSPLRQMLLTFRPAETFDDFARKLQTLRKEFDTEDVSETVAEIIRRAAAQEHAK